VLFVAERRLTLARPATHRWRSRNFTFCSLRKKFRQRGSPRVDRRNNVCGRVQQKSETLSWL